MNLKILVLSYLFPNPVQRNYGVFVYNRIQAIQEFNELRVIAPIQWYPFKDWLRPELVGVGNLRWVTAIGNLKIFYPRFPVLPRYMKWFDAVSYFMAVWPIAKRLKKDGFSFDLVDVHWTYPDILAGYLLAKLSNKPFIVTVRGREALYLEENSARKLMLDSLLRKADAVIALSTQLAEMVAITGVEPAKISVVLNGVDTDGFCATDRSKAREQLKLPQDRIIILSIGRLTREKGHQHIIKTLPYLAAKHAVELHIIGGINPESDCSESLREMIAILQLDNVYFHSDTPHGQLAAWYNASNLFCLASHSEGCPNVVLEALACGTPVVVTDVGAVSDIVENGVNGYIVREVDALAETVDKALSRLWDRELIANKMKSLTWQSCARKVDEVYHETLTNVIGDGELHREGWLP